MPTRYALYFLPEDGSALARLGQTWLDALPAPLTRDARVYGFHATLKAPFRLAEGHDEAQLRQACARFAAEQPALELAPPMLALLQDFFALRPAQPSAALQELGAQCVRHFDSFRAPLSEAELAKRLKSPLSERQCQLLAEWGYPYVFDEYRFHMTLTGRLDAAGQSAIEPVLRALTAEATAEPLRIGSLCLVRQPAGGDFALLQRFALEGACVS